MENKLKIQQMIPWDRDACIPANRNGGPGKWRHTVKML